MTDRYRPSPVSQVLVWRSPEPKPEASWGLIPMGGLGSSIPQVCPPTVGHVDTRVNVYDFQLGSSHHPAPLSLDESSVSNAHPYTLLYTIPRPQTRVNDNPFAVQVVSLADRAPRNLFPLPFPHVNTDTTQSHDQMNKSWAVNAIVENSSDHERAMTDIPMMPFDARPLSDSYSPPTYSTSGVTMLDMMPQEMNEASARYTNEGEYLASSTQLYMTPDRGSSAEESAEKLYDCSFCRVSFSQPQGLTRHSRDIHSPKKRCEVCVDFTWSQGRSYVYRQHLQDAHPGFVSQSVSATPIRRRRGVKLKDRHFR